jgi:1-acyl-sn-glycerol-3-phosphate acyltransferase
MQVPSLWFRVLSILRFSIGFLIIIISALIYIPLVALCLPWRGLRVRMGNWYGKVVGPSVVYAIGMRPKIVNHERIKHNYPAIYLSNHSTALDPMLAIWLCPTGGCGVAKKEISYVPFFGQAYYLSGHILLDRSNHEAAIASMQEAANWVKKYNLSLWIWPEGTRSDSGRILPFKKGFAHLAIATGLPIVPIVVKGAQSRWPARTFLIYPGSFEVEVLPPVDTSSWAKETLAEHVAEIENIYINALPEDQRPLPKGFEV